MIPFCSVRGDHRACGVSLCILCAAEPLEIHGLWLRSAPAAIEGQRQHEDPHHLVGAPPISGLNPDLNQSVAPITNLVTLVESLAVGWHFSNNRGFADANAERGALDQALRNSFDSQLLRATCAGCVVYWLSGRLRAEPLPFELGLGMKYYWQLRHLRDPNRGMGKHLPYQRRHPSGIRTGIKKARR